MDRRVPHFRQRPLVSAVAVAAVSLVPSAASAHAASSAANRDPPPPALRQTPGTKAAYQPPVDSPISDPFRPPAGPYGPGNRGIEYATSPGTPVRAIGAGAVIFAGQVGGQLFVTVQHPDGLRSSYSWLASVGDTVGQIVRTGDIVGTSGERFHLGVRLPDGTYIDPGSLFGPQVPRHAVLDDAYLTADGP